MGAIVRTMIDAATVRRFYRRLNHCGLGVTELVALNKDSGAVVATGFFDDEDRFVSACFAYNRGCNVYAGRNPRQLSFSGTRNLLDTVGRKRAKDTDIQYLTAISLDIDPVRAKGAPATPEQRKAAVSFALDLQWDIGGDVDDSGNGAYLWIPLKTPVEMTAENSPSIKRKCRQWQSLVVRKFKPEQYGLRIDGCYDFSRIKRVIGTYNHKACRISRFVRRGQLSDEIREEILSGRVVPEKMIPVIKPASDLPEKFKNLLKWNPSIRELWQYPDVHSDSSKHDWMLGLRCVEAGIVEPEELAAILMRNPFGKFRRDKRREYVERTVGKLVGERDKKQVKFIPNSG